MRWGYAEYLRQPEWFVKELSDFFKQVLESQQKQ